MLKYILFQLTVVCTGCSARIVLGVGSGTDLEEGSGRFPTRDDGNPVDLHGHDPFCADVSTWGEVEYVGKLREKCNTTFVKEPKYNKKRVCDNVTEISCDIVPYTKCVLTMDPVTVKDYRDEPEIYRPWDCVEKDKTVKHNKLIPQCKDETKLNCVTLWKLDEEGNQVWAGNEDCQPVTWRKCELIPIEVDFVTQVVECERKGEIRWEDCVEINKSEMAIKMTCDVFHAKDCTSKTYEKCATIDYTEWFERPIETCENVMIQMPNQTWEHKKKCLLQEDSGNNLVHRGNHDDHHGHHDETTEQTNVDTPEQEKSRNGKQVQPTQRLETRERGKEVEKGQSLLRNIPSHPSIDGFELQGQESRNGKAMKSESPELSKPVVVYASQRHAIYDQNGQPRFISVPASLLHQYD